MYEFQMLILLVVDPSILEMVPRGHFTVQTPVRSDALGEFWIPVHLFSDQLKPTPLMLGMDFDKEHRCLMNFGEDLIKFPTQSDRWWPLFVSSRGLYSMPLCGQWWEPSLPTL